jgi:PAS domain S-box-containing protein
MPLLYRGEPHVLQVVRDITERKQAERALATREAQYRAIFDGASDAMVLWSRERRVVDVNRAFTEISGLARSEAIGSTLSDRLPPDEAERRLDFVQRALAGEACQMETTGFGRDGRRFELEVRYLPIIHRGEPHVLSVGRDVSARRRAEAEQAEFEARLRHAQKMEAIGQLTGGIAHDFNNILTAVKGYLEMAAERAEQHLDAKLSHQLDQAQLAANHARDLIAQMMTFARPQRVARTALRLSPVVRQAVQLLRATMPASIRLDVGADDQVAPVEADAVQLEQVLFNLCINARDAIGSGTGSIRIQLRAERAGEGHCASCRTPIRSESRWVELAVTDSGCGIVPEVLDRMFDPFFTTKEVGRGSGMGLAMVHGIVHEHGGHLRVDSVLGRGSTFRVLLPAVSGALDPAAAAVGAPRAAKAERLEGKVLVVEDQAMVGGFMEELLGSWGLEPVLRDDPRDALRLLEDGAEAIDLLITDLTMPHLTGIELAARAAALRPGLPVLVYTGDPGEPEPETLVRSGIAALIRKPIDPAALRAELRRLLSVDREPVGAAH